MNAIQTQLPVQNGNYRKLPGRGVRRQLFAARTYRLWLGEDHLLAVEKLMFEESYRRFYFNDIQAIIVERTSRWLTTGIIYAVIAFALMAAVSVDYTRGEGGELAVFFAVMAGVSALFSLRSFASGPSCRTRLQTAVQSEDLPSIHTVRLARRIMERIEPLIVAVQGEAAPEHLENAVQIPITRLITERKREANAANYAYLLLFIGLLADGLLGFVYLAAPKQLQMIQEIGSSLALFEIVIACVALARSRGARGGTGFRVVSILAILLGIGSFAAGVYIAISAAPQLMHSAEQTGTFDYSKLPGFVEAILVSSTIASVLGLTGMSMWLLHRARERSEATRLESP